MLHKTKTSTAKCNEDIYVSYLLSEPQYTSCTRLSSIMKNISHDSVNRFLDRERFEPKDLFEEERDKINLIGGVLSVDDSVIDKPYSDVTKTAFIDFFWSGKHKRTVKGLNLITLFYTDINGISVPVNYRICDKLSGKTKNDYFREMLIELLSWGLFPAWVTGDSWYSSLDNLKFIRKHNLNFMFGVENNRRVSIERGQYIQIQKLEGWLGDEQTVYLKDYGMVRLFRQIYKEAYRYYIVSVANLAELDKVTFSDFKYIHSAHWRIEQFHRAIKQVCNIERFQVRKENPVKNHVYCAIKAFVRLEFMRLDNSIVHWYELKRDLFLTTIRQFIIATANNHIDVNA